MNYDQFIETKRISFEPVGFELPASAINPALSGKYQFQNDVVRWNLQLGKSADFLDCGLGKSFIEGEFAHQVINRMDAPALVASPLGVSAQLKREFAKLGYEATLCKKPEDMRSGINITNYERIDKFDPSDLSALILDESSILKGRFGITRLELTDFAANIPFKLCATATPAPNDFEELIYHAVFLGVMSEMEIKALFFTQDGNSSNKLRLKRYAQQEFWRWVASWAIAMRKPSDLGYSDEGFVLPKLNIHQVRVDIDWNEVGQDSLFVVEAKGINEQRMVRNATLENRILATQKLVTGSKDQWTIWCKYNPESEAVTKALAGAVEVTGSDSPEFKEQAFLDFAEKRIDIMVTKAEIAGFGLNWQNCNKTILFGWDNSYEQFYQLTRRFWRHGQTEDVDVYILTTDADGGIINNMERKEMQSNTMFDEIIKNINTWNGLVATMRQETPYQEDVQTGEDWTMYLGDSVKTIDKLASNSVGCSVFSPPFPLMYCYTNSPHDMGNVRSIKEMIDQFSYLMAPEKLMRVLMPGRSVFIHITQAVAQKGRDGYVGMKDFRGKIIEMMENHGWIHYGEVTIGKNPQVKAIRTRDAGLQFKSLATDASRMHVAMPDMLLQFQKPGDNPVPIRAGKSEKYNNPNGWVTNDDWINWAHPVWNIWNDIDETDVLNVVQARDTNDERHLCPLQLPVIERVIKVWSNPDELIYSPFGGIGSEGYVALLNRRRFVGCELKESYFRSAVRNLNLAVSERSQATLFDMVAA